jgi:hypothetical protein
MEWSKEKVNKQTNNDTPSPSQKTKTEPREHHYHMNDVKLVLALTIYDITETNHLYVNSLNHFV